MVKKSKLLGALDAHKGRDYEAEKRKKVVKAAEKRKRQKAQKQNGDSDEEEEEVPQLTNGGAQSKANGTDDAAADEFESFPSSDEDQDNPPSNDLIPQPEQDAEASASELEQDSDFSYSDLSASDREDVVPYQRMTINNALALTSSRKRVAIVSDRPSHPFHYHNSLVSNDKPADDLIPDPMDDETRELMFYKIARDATITARDQLKKEKVPFTRPADYFAEMVKTDEHMGRVKKKLVDEASSKKASEEARRLRDAKRFGKQVQVAREQERAKERKDTLGKIQELKRKRKDNDTGRITEGDDLFEEINVDTDAKKRRRREDGSREGKRQTKDKKFGFGGKKRFSKSGTAESSADMSGFSASRMKGRGGRGGGRGGGRAGSRGRGGAQRLGKSRRSAGRT